MMNVHDLFVIHYCEAHGATTDRRCSREGRQWTHVFAGDQQLYVCDQHYAVAERYRRRGTAEHNLMIWQGLLRMPPE